MRKFSLKPDPAPPDVCGVTETWELPTSPATESTAPVDPTPMGGVLTALLDFTLPSEAQRCGSSMGRNPRHDLIQAAGHIGSAVQQLKSVAADATAAKEFAAADSLTSLIERLA
jgi:hypothetical protein